MRPPIGFVLITHGNPAQAQFLCGQLNRQFDSPPIVIHHDFSKCDANVSSFPSNVTFVADWVPTKWGGWGIVEGELRALKILYGKHDPDWFVVLSGADFPIKPADRILSDLYDGGFDAYLDHRKINYCTLPIPSHGFGENNYVHPAWETLAFERYMAIGFGFYKIATCMRWKKKAVYLRQKTFIRAFTPFDGRLECYAGDFWITANRRAAMSLIDDSETNQKILAHFRKRPVPDEGLQQTILCNDSSLKISKDNLRFTDWTGCTNHPNLLGEERFEELERSSDLFARKFVFDPSALDRFGTMLIKKGVGSRSTSLV